MANPCKNLTMRNPLMERALKNRLDKISGITDTIRERLRKQVAAGLKNEESTEQIAERIRKTLNSERGYARVVARTEVNAAASDARSIQAAETYGEDGYVKEWLSARDENVRESHQIDGETADPDEEFSNGLLRPHDPSAPAEEVVNCRCIVLMSPKKKR